jgi:hypothetical protein
VLKGGELWLRSGRAAEWVAVVYGGALPPDGHTKPLLEDDWSSHSRLACRSLYTHVTRFVISTLGGRAAGAGRGGNRGQARAYAGRTAELHAAIGGGGDDDGAEETFPRTTSAPPLLRQAFCAANEHFGLMSLGSNSSTVEYNRHQVRISPCVCCGMYRVEPVGSAGEVAELCLVPC